MTKRITSLFFLILANIILLAHSLVPHHYHAHSSIACTEDTHCEASEICTEDIQHESKHQHHDPSNISECQLKQAAVLPAGLHDQDYGLDWGHIHFHDGYTASASQHFDAFLPLLLASQSWPDRTSQYLSFICASAGLRAPPII